jgi:hypothetical protein
MPNIRVATWNVEHLSDFKLMAPGAATSIGQVIADLQPDVVVLLEVTNSSAIQVMTAISAAVNAASGGGNNYTGWLVSYRTGNEAYGLLIRDLNVVRPIVVGGGAIGAGTAADPALVNLDQTQFVTWPHNNFANTAYPAPAPVGNRPRLPLTDVYATSPPRGRNRQLFAGQTMQGGGYALGRGFRMPALILLNIGGNYLLPILVCHLGAVRSGANPLARAQFGQFKLTHIAQMYSAPTTLLNQGSLWVDNVAWQVRNIVVTGDFNIDFLQNATVGNALATGNNFALSRLSPTLPNAGSNAPPAAGPPVVAPPGAPPANNPAGRIWTAVPNMALRTAITQVGTMLHKYDAAVVPANTAALVGACFDNFFYGGPDLTAHQVVLGAGTDAGLAQNFATNIVRGSVAGAANAYNVSGAWAHYTALGGVHHVAAAPNLANTAALPPPPLDPNSALIGARLISDHLPVVVQFNLP